MVLEHFEVEGFRSIRHAAFSPGPIAVLYGPNGSGKSNLLAALDRFWKVWHHVLAGSAGPGAPVKVDGCFSLDDLRRGASPRIHFKATVRVGAGGMPVDGWETERWTCEITVSLSNGQLHASFDALYVELVDPLAHTVRLVLRSPTPSEPQENLDPSVMTPLGQRWWAAAVANAPSWLHIQDSRGDLSSPAPVEAGVSRSISRSSASPDDPRERVTQLALAGNIAEAAYLAKTSPDLALEERLDTLRQLLRAAPLLRPDFRPALDQGRYLLQEIVTISGKKHAIPLDLSGLGVRQIYAILGAIVLSGARLVAIEEPESHLHARSSGLQLREVLRRLVPSTVSQMFIATHSSLFDLDPTGYFDVRLDPEQGTIVERRADLVDLDRQHSYEPGAARHALMRALDNGEPDRVVFERGDGSPVTASEMIQMLVEDTPEAVAFLDVVTSAAVRAVTLRAGASRVSSAA